MKLVKDKIYFSTLYGNCQYIETQKKNIFKRPIDFMKFKNEKDITILIPKDMFKVIFK